MTGRVAPQRQGGIALLACLLAVTSFVVNAAPAPRTDTYGPPAPFALGPAPVQAYCATKAEFSGRLTSSSSSTTAVTAVTNPTVYGYLSNINVAWSCMGTYRYDGLAWNTGASAGTYVWGALINDLNICNWVVGTDDYLKANGTTDCPDTDAEYAMSIDFDGERVYQNDNAHDTLGDFGFAHDDCTTWYASKVTKTGASFLTSATNNRPRGELQRGRPRRHEHHPDSYLRRHRADRHHQRQLGRRGDRLDHRHPDVVRIGRPFRRVPAPLLQRQLDLVGVGGVRHVEDVDADQR